MRIAEQTSVQEQEIEQARAAAREYIDGLVRREQVAQSYGVLELHFQGGRLVRHKISRTEEYKP